MMQGSPTQPREAGFAMLFVFLLAGIIAISLYMELPRVVFEAQRSREQLLIDRGEQYKRGIQLYFRQFRTYPPNMDALESTNSRRYLRHRYKDPMTGEDEWRLIRGMPNGVFLDSLVQKAPGQAEKQGDTAAASTTTAPELWMQRRPSDVTLPPQPDQQTANEPGVEMPPDPGSVPVEPAVEQQAEQAQQQPEPAPGQQPGVTAGVAGVPVVAGAPGVPGAPGMPYFPGGPPVSFGQPPAQQAPGQNLSPFQPQVVPGVPVAPGSLPGQPSTPTNPALEMIRNMLTTPNPRGLAAIQVAPGNQQSTGVAGIAGVASKREAEGIMVYNDRTKYNEWEFLYDARLEQAAMAQIQGAAQQTQGAGQPGTDGSGVFPGDGSNQRRGPGMGGPGGQGPGRGFGGGGGFGSGGRGGGMTPFPMPGGFGNFPPGGAPQPQAPRR